MMRTIAMALALSAAAAGGGCSKGKEQPAAKAKVEVVPPAIDAAAVAPPPPPYSPQVAAELIDALATCPLLDGCEPARTLRGFGSQAAADLLAAIASPAARPEVRRMAAELLGGLKLPDVGPKLVEIGLTTDDSLVQSDVFAAAGQSGGQATFEALIAAYAKAIGSTDDDHEIPLRAGLRGFRDQSLGWAAAQLAGVKGQDGDPVGAADLFRDNAQPQNLPMLVTVLEKTKDPMARHRLASRAIELGDLAHFDVFVAGLSSKDEYDRADAANFLAEVADMSPPAMRPQLVELLEKGKAADAGGLTAQGYDRALAKLKAP